MNRQNVYSGTLWEPHVAYCRATRVGDTILVSGTVAVDDRGNALTPGDAYAQTKHVLGKVAEALEGLGSGLQDVVRTRTFITDMAKFEDFARAHRESFAGIDPAATCIEVARLVATGLVVEVEVDAIAGAGRARGASASQPRAPARKPTLWKPTALGDVMAERTLARGGASTVKLRLGRPVRDPNAAANDPWWCPLEITGLGATPWFSAAAGEDTVQALVLALRLAESVLLAAGSPVRGKPRSPIEWLGDRKSPIFGTWPLPESASSTKPRRKPRKS